MTEESKFLNERQLRDIDNSIAQYMLKQKEAEIVKLRLQNAQLKAQNFKLIAELKSVEVSEANHKAEEDKKRHKKFMEDLKKEIGITSPTFGYDPETGEIK